MKTAIKAIAALFVTLVSVDPGCDLGAGQPAFGATERPSTTEVLAIMARVPEKAHPARPGHYEQAGDAKEIAASIANVADNRETAALMSVYAAYESSMQKCAVGDGGRSLGTWQLMYVPREIACDPMRAAPLWLSMAKEAKEKHCLQSDPDDRLSILTGGSCSRGVLVARTRARIAREIASATP